jgi:hypothetical protein
VILTDYELQFNILFLFVHRVFYQLNLNKGPPLYIALKF